MFIIINNILTYIKLIRGFIRLWIFSFCPQCNSSAPELYDCKVCEWPPPYSFYGDKSLKSKAWGKYIK